MAQDKDKDNNWRNPMTSKEPKSDSNRNQVVIWVAVIGLVGTLGAAVVANLDKFFPPGTVSNVSHSEESNLPQANPRVEVEKLAGKWCAAWLGGDTDTFVSLSSEPFFFDHNLVLTKSELRSEYIKLQNEKGDVWRNLKVLSIKVQTAGELKRQGHDLSRDRIFSSMNLTLDDYAVAVTIELNGRKEGVLLVVRRVGNDFEVVGMWD